MQGAIQSNAYNMGMANACGPAAPEAPPVHGAVNNMNFEQDITSNLLADLYARLDRVLRPTAPASPQKDGPARLSQSELHGRMNDLVVRQEGFNSSLRDLLDRLTV